MLIEENIEELLAELNTLLNQSKNNQEIEREYVYRLVKSNLEQFKIDLREQGFNFLNLQSYFLQIEEHLNIFNWEAMCQNLNLFLRAIRPFNIKKVINLVEKFDKQTEQLANKKVLFLLGEKGTGKKTLLQFLAGFAFEKKIINDLPYLILKEANCQSLEDSDKNKIIEKDNLAFNIFCIDGSKIDITFPYIYICQSPGLFDELEGVETNLAVQIGIARALKKCKQVKPLVVISKNSIGDRCQGLKELFRHLSKMVLDYKRFGKSAIYLFTKFKDNDKDNEKLIKALITDMCSNQENQTKGQNSFNPLLSELKKIAKNSKKKFYLIDPIKDNRIKVLKRLYKSDFLEYPQEVFKYEIITNLTIELQNQIYISKKMILFGLQNEKYDLVFEKIYDLNILNEYIKSEYLALLLNDCYNLITDKKLELYTICLQIIDNFDITSQHLNEELEKLFKYFSILNKAERLEVRFLSQASNSSKTVVGNLYQKLVKLGSGVLEKKFISSNFFDSEENFFNKFIFREDNYELIKGNIVNFIQNLLQQKKSLQPIENMKKTLCETPLFPVTNSIENNFPAELERKLKRIKKLYDKFESNQTISYLKLANCYNEILEYSAYNNKFLFEIKENILTKIEILYKSICNLTFCKEDHFNIKVYHEKLKQIIEFHPFKKCIPEVVNYQNKAYVLISEIVNKHFIEFENELAVFFELKSVGSGDETLNSLESFLAYMEALECFDGNIKAKCQHKLSLLKNEIDIYAKLLINSILKNSNLVLYDMEKVINNPNDIISIAKKLYYDYSQIEKVQENYCRVYQYFLRHSFFKYWRNTLRNKLIGTLVDYELSFAHDNIILMEKILAIIKSFVSFDQFMTKNVITEKYITLNYKFSEKLNNLFTEMCFAIDNNEYENLPFYLEQLDHLTFALAKHHLIKIKTKLSRSIIYIINNNHIKSLELQKCISDIQVKLFVEQINYFNKLYMAITLLNLYLSENALHQFTEYKNSIISIINKWIYDSIIYISALIQNYKFYKAECAINRMQKIIPFIDESFFLNLSEKLQGLNKKLELKLSASVYKYTEENISFVELSQVKNFFNHLTIACQKNQRYTQYLEQLKQQLIDNVLKKISKLQELNFKSKAYEIKKLKFQLEYYPDDIKIYLMFQVETLANSLIFNTSDSYCNSTHSKFAHQISCLSNGLDSENKIKNEKNVTSVYMPEQSDANSKINKIEASNISLVANNTSSLNYTQRSFFFFNSKESKISNFYHNLKKQQFSTRFINDVLFGIFPIPFAILFLLLLNNYFLPADKNETILPELNQGI